MLVFQGPWNGGCVTALPDGRTVLIGGEFILSSLNETVQRITRNRTYVSGPNEDYSEWTRLPDLPMPDWIYGLQGRVRFEKLAELN
jgi:hypothetical protein